jgi:uncharacterized protein (DUF1697 family)
MPRYVAFFSAMNVGGNRLTMADLRDALVREDFEDVETVIASGNVLFEHEERPSTGLTDKLQYVIRDRFDFESMAIVRSRDELAAIIAANPFAADGDDQKVHVHFLEDEPPASAFAALHADHAERGAERMVAAGNVLYIDYVDGVGRSKLTAAFIESRLGCRGTARNMRSLVRILEKMD